MCRGWWIGALVLTFTVAWLPARAAEPVADSKAADAETEALREQVRNAVEEGDYEKAETPLGQLLKKDLQNRNAGPLPDDTTPKDKLKAAFDDSLTAGRYDYAAYYLDRLQGDKPNPFGGWLDLTIWTIVVFLLLMFVLGKFAWTPMLQGLQKREKDIKAAVDDARAAREEATRLREEVQAERRKIEDMRREIIQKAQADAQRTAEEIMAKVKADAQAERDRGRRELETERAQAWQALMQQTADLAVMITTKAIGRQMTPDDHRRFVDEALVDIRQAGNGQATSASV